MPKPMCLTAHSSDAGLGGRRVSWLPGRALTQVMECEARRGGEAVKEQMQQRRAGQGGPGT